MMTTKDQVIQLKQKQLKNADIARLLKVSKQYVSHVIRTSQAVEGKGNRLGDEEFVTTSVAGRMLGVSEATIRRWSDEGKIPSFRINIGRMDRRFSSNDLKNILVRKS